MSVPCQKSHADASTMKAIIELEEQQTVSVGTDKGGQMVQGKRGKSKWIKEGLADGKARKNYNHGQKSWDTFAFLGHFPIHTGPTLPSSEFQLCIGSGEGEQKENFEKDALV